MKGNSLNCFGCKNLISEPDGAGGGIYRCKLAPGIIKGEWGHWTDEDDIPRPFNDECKTL